MMQKKGMLLGLMVALLVMAGCGIVSTVPADGGRQLTKVKLSQGIQAISTMPITIAEQKGFFREQGLAVEYISVQGMAQTTAAMLSGDVEFGQSAVGATILAYNKGERVQMIANFFDHLTMVGVVHREALPTGMTPEAFQQLPLEKRLQALKGRKFGIDAAGSLIDQVTRLLLKRAGLDAERDVEIVSVQSPAALQGALQQRKIDAFSVSPPAPFQAIADGYGVLLFDGPAGEFEGPDGKYYAIGIATTAAYAEKNPDTVRGFATAIARANDWAIAHPEETVALMQQVFAKVDPKVVDLSTRFLAKALTPGARYKEDGVKVQVEILRSGPLKNPLTTAEGTYWTNAYLPKE